MTVCYADVSKNNLIAHHNVATRAWNCREIAEIAGCVPLYENAYPFFHAAVHSSIDGILLQPSDLYDELLIDLVTVISIDTISIAAHEFVPIKTESYKAQIKDWQKEREAILNIP